MTYQIPENLKKVISFCDESNVMRMSLIDGTGICNSDQSRSECPDQAIIGRGLAYNNKDKRVDRPCIVSLISLKDDSFLINCTFQNIRVLGVVQAETRKTFTIKEPEDINQFLESVKKLYLEQIGTKSRFNGFKNDFYRFFSNLNELLPRKF